MSIIGDILGRFLSMGLFLLVWIAVYGGYFVVAVRAAQDHVNLLTVPILPYIVVYFSAVGIPLLGGDDWLGITGIYAEHEVFKLFIIGLPIFFLVSFYLQRKGVTPLASLIYSLACWAGGLAVSFCVILLIVFVVSFIISIKTFKGTLDVATETSQPYYRKCPNCFGPVPIGDSYCPQCGREIL